MLNLLPERLDRILLLGAHCDDIPIGAGGMLLELCRAYPGVQVTALVLTGAGSLREEEERAALAAFTPARTSTSSSWTCPTAASRSTGSGRRWRWRTCAAAASRTW